MPRPPGPPAPACRSIGAGDAVVLAPIDALQVAEVAVAICKKRAFASTRIEQAESGQRMVILVPSLIFGGLELGLGLLATAEAVSR